MKFLVDMPLSPALARWLRHEGHDAVPASDLGLFDADDMVIFGRCIAEGRVVVTADLDFSRLLALSASSGPGLILFRGALQKDLEIQIRLDRLLRAVPHSELSNSLVVIDQWRARLRRLPLK